jgi:hypothetical protein
VSLKEKWEQEHKDIINRMQNRLADELSNKPITLNDVYNAYTGSGIYIEDTRRIDVGLAVLANAKLNGLPIWLQFVGASGDIKTTLLETMEIPEETFVLYKITPRTLITGKDDEGAGDLVQYTWNKTVIIFDLAEIMSKKVDDKDAIFAQMRNWYDGRLGGSFGTGANKDVTGKPPQMLIGCTPTIKSEFLMNQHLGTRELMYEVDTDSDKGAEAALRIAEAGNWRTIISDIKFIVYAFWKGLKPLPSDFRIPPEVRAKLMSMAKDLALWRVTAKVDWYNGDLITKPTVEKHTRLIQQFYQMYKALKMLDENYPDDRALEIIAHIVDSSCDEYLKKVYQLLGKSSVDENVSAVGMKTSEVCQALKLSYKTAKVRLNILWSLGVIDREELEEGYKTTHYWRFAGTWDKFDGVAVEEPMKDEAQAW